MCGISYCVVILTKEDNTKDARVCTDRCSDWFNTLEEADRHAHEHMRLKPTGCLGLYTDEEKKNYYVIKVG
jgi:hypothetical protein